MKDELITKNALHELPKDERDYSFTIKFGAVPAKDLPTEDFLVAIPLEAKNQDINYASDYCAAYAAAEAAEFEDQVIFVPEYTFAYAKWIIAQKYGDSSISSFGLNLRDACSAGVNGGFLPRSLDPFKCDTAERPPRNFIADFKNWPETLAENAEKYLKQGYYTADGPYDTFDNFRSVLWKNMGERRAIITGCYWRASWQNAIGGVIPKQYENGGTPHAFVFIGQKTLAGEIHLVARLSSGATVGDQGLYYFPREVVNKEVGAFGAFTFKDLGPIIPTPDGVKLTNVNKWNPLWMFKTLINLFFPKEVVIPTIPVKVEPMPKIEPIKTTIITNRERLFNKAKEVVGTDVTPEDTTPDTVACAETVNMVHKLAFGDQIGGATSTYYMYAALRQRKDFKEVTDPLPGDVIISPTGYGNGKLPNGHVGIMDENGVIMSNASSTGLLDTKYNLETWRARYQQLGGFPVKFYRKQ